MAEHTGNEINPKIKNGSLDEPTSNGVNKTVNETELLIVDFWNEKNIFKKSLEKDSPMGEFVFYDGPPTANGRPGIHHLEARAFKDAIPRYKTMRGYHVRRKGGWDTHGLPVELQVEKSLGLTSKKQIEEYGVAKFNNACRSDVWTYIDEWQKFTDRVGYWIDHEDPYITYDASYIESLWNVVKQVDKKNLLYKDYRIVPWCSRCGTGLSSHELAQGYKDVKDLSVTAKFKVLGQDPSNTSGQETYILAWTTTPWTLPGNVALAVGDDISYVKFEYDNSILITSLDFYNKESNFDASKEKPKLIKELKGTDLVGLEYEPLYPYLKNTIIEDQQEKLDEHAYKVYSADFVTATDGTGIVHTAVMYGQDDFILGTELNLPKHHLVNDSGIFISGTDFLEGRFVKDEDVAIDIIKDLAHRGILFKKEKFEHSYPHCWRCQTPLIYYARDSWYIRMSELRDQLVMNNDFINWEPKHIQNGRFGEWIREVKDWAISRERYWGTPLPVWESVSGERHIFTHRDELKAQTKKSGNKYTLIRHGEAESNISGIVSYATGNIVPVTQKGIEQIKLAAKGLKDKKIDLIYTSPFMRTRQTADMIAEIIDLPKVNIIEDDRLIDLNAGIFEGKKWDEYFDFYNNIQKDRFTTPPPGGETLNDVKKRLGEFMYHIENTLEGKNILIVTHGVNIWMANAIAGGMNEKEAIEFRDLHNKNENSDWIHNAVATELDFIPLPHNDNYELDLHRPYIDDYPMFDNDGNKLTRVKEVMDCWFDSGCMPFAQDGYPFKTDKIAFPADYISEGIDQTRGWFYTLHAVAALMGQGPAYKNVICLGLIMDKDGQKMSKSRGNTVNPWDMCEKYGADALRFWMYSVNQPGDFKNFDEKTVSEVVRKVFNLLRNVYAFYDLYRKKEDEPFYAENFQTEHHLDKWILVKLNNLIINNTNSMDEYSLLNPTRDIRDFIEDLSTWYLRRTRDRLRGGNKEAHMTLYYVLKTLIKLMAPFAPFVTEELWQELRLKNEEESIHLTSWPESKNIEEGDMVLEEMEKVRSIVNIGHALRKENNIPNRQPLRAFYINQEFSMGYIAIIADELNVESVIVGNKIELDINIDEDLKNQGNFRELVRVIQDMRKKNEISVDDKIKLKIKTDMVGRDFILFWKEALLSEVSASEVIFDDEISSEGINIDSLKFAILII